MGISATFSKTNKKINSTKLPVAAASDIALTVELKDVVNLFTPTLIISSDVFMSGGQIVNPMPYNYCYLPDFNRYYFVRSWSWILGRWECALEVDVMASFKTEIGNSTCMVLRSASNYDPDIIDTKYPTKIEQSGLLQTKVDFSNTSIWNTNIKTAAITDGFYVISVVNSDNSAVGGVSYYAFSAGAMAELMNKLFSAPTWMNISDANISADMQKMLFNPMQYITSCMWIPRGFDTTGNTAIHTLPLGWWSLTLTSSFYRVEVSSSAIEVSYSGGMAYHPQYNASKRRWVGMSPFTTAAVYVPPFGFIALDTTKIYRAKDIVIKVRIDVLTGRGTLYISTTYDVGGVTYNGGVIYTTVAQVGVPVSIAQMALNWDALSNASTWVMAAGVSLATGGLQEGLKDFKNGLVDGIKNMWNQSQAKEAVDNVISTVSNAVESSRGDTGAGLGAGAGLGRQMREIVDAYNASNNASPAARAIGFSGAGAAAALPSVVNQMSRSALNSSGGSSLLSTLKEIAGDIGSTALAAAGTCTSTGSTGGFAGLQELAFVQWYFQWITGIDDTHNGLPLCQSKKISTLSGFVLCGNTDDFSANCTPAERQAICGIMEAGFYYE